MQIKYFQPLHDCVRTFEQAYFALEFTHLPQYPTLASYHEKLEQPTQEQAKEERDAIAYVASLYKEVTYDEERLKKPSVELATRAFQRIVDFCDVVHDTRRNDRGKNPLVQKEVACAHYYMFQFSKEAWVEKLPEEIITIKEFQEKLNERIRHSLNK